MALTLDLRPELETRLQAAAARQGLAAAQYAEAVLEAVVEGKNTALWQAAVEQAARRKAASQPWEPVRLMTLPVEERRRLLEAAAEKAAPLYEADLALPVEERELTAFTALNDDPILENYHADTN